MEPDDAPTQSTATETTMAQWLSRRIRAAPNTDSPRRASRGRSRGGDSVHTSAAGPDARDPQLAGSVLSGWLTDHGYNPDAAAGSLAARWAEIAGEDVSAHVRAEVVDTDKGRVLILAADSTTWATQLTLLLPQLRERIQAVIGTGVIDDITITGPASPRVAAGRWRVKGPGPRDTYG